MKRPSTGDNVYVLPTHLPPTSEIVCLILGSGAIFTKNICTSVIPNLQFKSYLDFKYESMTAAILFPLH